MDVVKRESGVCEGYVLVGVFLWRGRCLCGTTGTTRQRDRLIGVDVGKERKPEQGDGYQSKKNL